MGAYSSFAILALANHVIVQLAMIDSGINYLPSTGQYAVLGDDVAINSDKVGRNYSDLMTSLGVEVNPVKGFLGSLIEFAKR
jgi:hypothetical protein